MELNEIKYGFKLVSIEKIDDVNSTLYQYEHLKSGGHVAYLANDDTNCCFAIGFRTTPEDSTGVCHIIEHSVLCGSKKFPLKEPFVNLLKSSLNTFLNAFTAYDWTMYPFASQTPKDFNNILEIYLDAVFNPISMVTNKPFLQEGWHLELNDIDETPCYKGVVYNEMKGAMSSVTEQLTQSTLEAMYKDTFYAFNSGGEPDDIPTLTYEAYKDFYHRHYTPQNAMTYFYGALDIEEKLKFLDEEYFSKYEKQEPIVIKPQAPLVNDNYYKEYDLGETEDVKDNTYMSLCYGLDYYSNQEELLAMSILCDVLLSNNDSILKKALLDAKLGQNVTYSLDDDNIVPALHIDLHKTNLNKKEEFKKVFEDEVRKLVNEGLDKESLLASINHFEFKSKEADMGGMPKGLIYAMSMMGSFNYNSDLKETLEFTKHYDKFKKELNNNYFEKLLEKYILNSNHHVEVVLAPSKTLGKKKAEAMAKKMNDLKETMSLEEKKALVKQTKELIAYQNHVDTPKELKMMPSLKLRDIPSTINYLDHKKLKINGMNGIYYEVNTNKIAYLNMYFDLNKVAFADLPYILILKRLLLNVGTSKYSSIEINKLKKTYLGDLYFANPLYNKSINDFSYKLKVGASALKENISYIPTLLNEVLLHSKFTKKETLVAIKQLINSMKQIIIMNGNSIAASMVASSYSKGESLRCNCIMGPNVYKFLNDLVNNYDHKKVSLKLRDICKAVFTKSNVLLSLSGDKETLEALKEGVREIKLPRKQYPEVLNVQLEKKNAKKALVIPSGVSYNAMGSSLDEFDEKYSGKFSVLSHILTYDYLWNEIRVKGGAYGTGIRVSRTGNISLSTYRDPNVTDSFKRFEGISTYLRNFKASKDEFNSYIIGTIGGFDGPLSIPSTINTWDGCYIDGFTKKDKMRIKKEIIHTKLEDIVELASLFDKINLNNSKATVGNEDKIKEYDFEEVTSL